ncbi:MAG: signal peptidase I [Clostridia bacterium]|nr:signal peptidase I [Clostridia bacterium]
MPKGLKKALDITTTVALVLFVIFVILLAGVRLFGIEPNIVLSGSMEPEILTGSIVYVKPISPEEAQNLKEGDTVTFVTKNDVKVTHKIYQVEGPVYVTNQHGEPVLDENGEKQVARDSRGYDIYMYTTYGINNINKNEESGYTLDGKPGVGNLASTNVVGKPVFSIPFLGYIANFVQQPPGQYIAIGGCFILVILTLFTGTKDDKKKGGEETEPEETEETEETEEVEPEEPEKDTSEALARERAELEALRRELEELKSKTQTETEAAEETETVEETDGEK